MCRIYNLALNQALIIETTRMLNVWIIHYFKYSYWIKCSSKPINIEAVNIYCFNEWKNINLPARLCPSLTFVILRGENILDENLIG